MKNKKLLLGLGSIGAIVVPVVSTMGCDMFGSKKTENKDGTQKINGQTRPTVHVGGTAVNKEYDNERKRLETYTSSDITLDPGLGMLSDVNHTKRNFLQFDNGLFKVEIDKQLIGANKVFADNNRAKKLAVEIAKQINIGPAILHLSKGIQILYSNNVASLGGDIGVQVALNNKQVSDTDKNIESTASLVAHEYGHHETLWDFHNIVGGKVGSETNAMKQVMLDSGYPNLARFMTGQKYNALDFTKAGINALASDYKQYFTDIEKTQGTNVFKNPNYPFSGSEVMTRVWNIMSTTVVSPSRVYGAGSIFPLRTSDETFRYFAQDSVFGKGKDGSRVNKLYSEILNKVNGYGSNSFSIEYNVNNKTLTGINFNNFGSKINPTKFVIKDTTGKVVKEINVSQHKGLFSHKSELLATDSSVKTVIPFSTLTPKNNPINFQNANGYTIEAYDGTKKLDLSSLKLTTATLPNGSIWKMTALEVVNGSLKIK